MVGAYDLWVDFASMADDGTLWSQSSNLRPGLRVTPGDVITAGSEDAVPARAQVISVEERAVVVKVTGDAAATAHQRRTPGAT
ncbi:MAG: hypothetical protein ACRD0C_15595 [Acidimicrobiia bacterium]